MQRIDPYKLEAVLRFMEANQIDPFTPPPVRAPEPRGLRRIQSERLLTRPAPREANYHSMERTPKKQKKKKSFFSWGDGLFNFFTGGTLSFSDLEYGPGIVEKLKAKFSRLSGLTTRETKRRSPSLDELSYNHNQHDYEPIR